VYTPLDQQQVKFDNLLKSDSISILLVTGAAGTGKTLFSCQEAIQQLKNRKKEKIVVTRPLVLVENEEIGFLPGDVNEKLLPWTLPIFDHMKEFVEIGEFRKYVHDQKIEISPLGYMRGRTFKNCFIILDEAQNTTPKQMKMFLTRIGKNSKIVINGDLNQSDINETNGLEDFIVRLKSKYQDSLHTMYQDGFGLVQLSSDKVYRNPIITKILDVYDD
jgi:phosphate starvation-inducible PhoH-like protein